ncbi:MAG TPA: GNAT family N-acetyltransferase [Candidatus Dormibacteraeota bacterium]
MRTLDVERLAEGDYDLIKPLLVELHMGEQVHYSDHPQLRREEIENHLATVPTHFHGENIVFGVRDEIGEVIGFCWLVLFDPGTGLEGEVAEVYVAPEHRGRGVGEILMDQAVRLFRDRRVTLGYVWTRPDNEAAVRLYRAAGFEPNRQLVLTWYPSEQTGSILPET